MKMIWTHLFRRLVSDSTFTKCWIPVAVNVTKSYKSTTRQACFLWSTFTPSAVFKYCPSSGLRACWRRRGAPHTAVCSDSSSWVANVKDWDGLWGDGCSSRWQRPARPGGLTEHRSKGKVMLWRCAASFGERLLRQVLLLALSAPEEHHTDTQTFI